MNRGPKSRALTKFSIALSFCIATFQHQECEAQSTSSIEEISLEKRMTFLNANFVDVYNSLQFGKPQTNSVTKKAQVWNGRFGVPYRVQFHTLNVGSSSVYEYEVGFDNFHKVAYVLAKKRSLQSGQKLALSEVTAQAEKIAWGAEWKKVQDNTLNGHLWNYNHEIKIDSNAKYLVKARTFTAKNPRQILVYRRDVTPNLGGQSKIIPFDFTLLGPTGVIESDLPNDLEDATPDHTLMFALKNEENMEALGIFSKTDAVTIAEFASITTPDSSDFTSILSELPDTLEKNLWLGLTIASLQQNDFSLVSAAGVAAYQSRLGIADPTTLGDVAKTRILKSEVSTELKSLLEIEE